jgi:hypothetical protein
MGAQVSSKLSIKADIYVSINSMVAPPRHLSGICLLQVNPGVGNLLEAKKSNICRLFRHLAVF